MMRLILLLAALLFPAGAQASCPSPIPFLFTPGQSPISSSQVNANFSTVFNCANSAVPAAGPLAFGTDQFSGGFGPMPMMVQSFNLNSIVGQTVNSSAPGAAILPVATTGACKVTTPTTTTGNICFGIYGLAELRSGANGVGVAVGGEVTARNFTGVAATTALPPVPSFGTSQAIVTGWNVTCGTQVGNNDCSIGMWVSNESGVAADPVFNTGIYVYRYRQYGVFVDAMPTASQTGLVVKGNGNGLIAQLLSTVVGSASVNALQVDNSGGTALQIRTNGEINFTQQQSTVGVAGAASPLPANPTGYFKVQFNGAEKVVPFYEH